MENWVRGLLNSYAGNSFSSIGRKLSPVMIGGEIGNSGATDNLRSVYETFASSADGADLSASFPHDNMNDKKAKKMKRRDDMESENTCFRLWDEVLPMIFVRYS
jgi:hypothetical protein